MSFPSDFSPFRLLLFSISAFVLVIPLAVVAQQNPRPGGTRSQNPQTQAAQPQPSPQTTRSESAPKPDVQASPEEEGRPRDPMSTPTFNGLRFRSLGPAFTSGRVIGFAVDPGNPSHFFVASASGGVWKTLNDGTTWTPVFDREGSYSIGCLALDPKKCRSEERRV